MKQILGFLALGLVFGSVARAEIPKATCDVMYDLRDAKGISVSFDRGQLSDLSKEPKSFSTNGFTAKAWLNPICPADAVCNEAQAPYEIQLELKKGESVSFFSQSLGEALKSPYPRASISLEVGNERVFVNCDGE